MIKDTKTFNLLLDSVSRFVRKKLIPNEEWVSKLDSITGDLVQEMKELGLFGMTIPEEYGGLGLTVEEEVRVLFELAQAAPAFRSLIGPNNGIVAHGIVYDGTLEQKLNYLPKLASGELIAAFALTEPETGSDAASLRTTAVRVGKEYVLNGTKRYILNAPEARLFTVMARTNPVDKGADGVSAFIVEAGAPGLALGKPDKKMGHRGSHTCDVIFEECHVPIANLIGGKEGMGFKMVMKVLDRSRLHISAVCVGAAERMLQEALTYALERRQFGQPIAEFQLIQAMLADSQTELYAARCMVLDAARRRDIGETISTEAACCKLFASEMCGRVADRALQIHGGTGYMVGYSIERFYRDVRLFRIYEGTSQIQQLTIARNMIRAARP